MQGGPDTDMPAASPAVPDPAHRAFYVRRIRSLMTRAKELERDIARNLAWWADHGPAVRESSAEKYREHYSRLLTDDAYRGRAILGGKLSQATARRMGLNRPHAPARPAPQPLVGGEIAYVGGKLSKIGDAFDSELPTYQEDACTTLRRYERERAEAEFAEHAAAETGMQMSEVLFQEKRIRDGMIRQQSAAIADRLKSVGVEAYRSDEYKCFVYWLHTRTVEELPAYRRICLIPYIAAMTRAPKLSALEYFLQSNQYARFWTFTTGRRCTAAEIPERLDWLFAKLRELNKQLGRRWGIEIVFRSTEFGTLEADRAGNRTTESDWGSIERDQNTGAALFHPHAHCVVLSRRGFIGSKWADAVNFVHQFWRRDGIKLHWDAGQMIRNPRECCKYVTKPGDILKLSSDELRAFYAATANRRLVRPMGVLAAEIRARREAGRTLRRKRIGRSLQWAEVLNHNRLNLETEAEKAARENLEDAFAMTDECQRLAALEPPSYPGANDGGRMAERGFSGDVTKVMARIGPAAGPTPFKEPRVLVMTNQTQPDVRAVQAHPLVVRLWAQTVQEWEAGRALAAPYRVHTGTLSGKAYQDDLPEFDPSPEPEPHLRPLLTSSL